MASVATGTKPAEAAAAAQDGGWSSEATRMLLLGGLQQLLGGGGRGIAALGPAAVRAALPLLAIYATGSPDEALQHGDENADALKERQSTLARHAGTKALLELIELASRTHPLTPVSEPFTAKRDGQAQAPRIEHVLALALAAMALFARAERGDQQQGDDKGEPAPAPQHLDRVTYVAVAPGEYQAMSGPMSPAEIRRYAMRERSYTQPELAMLAKHDNSFTVLPASSGPGNYAALAMHQRPTAEQYGMMMLGKQGASGCAGQSAGGSCGCGSCGCGSGVPSCGCGRCGGGHIVFPPARYDADGKCKSVLSISCETKSRVRECFKQSLCDLLRCVGDEVCEDGRFAKTKKPDLGKCLEGFVCTLLTCLPEAICPPPPPSTVCLTQPVSDCDCNYAVGS